MLLASFTAILLAAGAPEMMIPEGTILPVILNETLNTARVQDNDPVLFSFADDIRSAGHRGPVLIPRGSNVVGRVVRSQDESNLAPSNSSGNESGSFLSHHT